MPTWLQTIIAIVGALGTICGILGLSTYLGERQRHKAQRKNIEEDKQKADLEELRKQMYMEQLRDIIKEENEKSVMPLRKRMDDMNDTVTSMNERLTLVANGTVDTLRDRILSTYNKCMKKGFRNQNDYENMHHMCTDYFKLGGNSFVRDCMNKFDALPSEEQLKGAQEKSLNEVPARKGSLALVETNN